MLLKILWLMELFAGMMNLNQYHADQLLFVYGTLIRGFANRLHHLLLAKHSDFLGNARFRGRLYDVGGYPGAVESQHNEDRITGELYAIHLSKVDFVFKLLDEYEGCRPGPRTPCLYIRKKCPIEFEGRRGQAWICLYNRPVEGLTRIEHGDYVKYLKQTEG